MLLLFIGYDGQMYFSTYPISHPWRNLLDLEITGSQTDGVLTLSQPILIITPWQDKPPSGLRACPWLQAKGTRNLKWKVRLRQCLKCHIRVLSHQPLTY